MKADLDHDSVYVLLTGTTGGGLVTLEVRGGNASGVEKVVGWFQVRLGGL